MSFQANTLARATPYHQGYADTDLHASSVAGLAVEVADELGLGPTERHEVELVGLLHDVGKAEMPTSILMKPGPLNAEEWARMESHTLLGQQLLERTDPSMHHIAGIVRSCHERYDGRGYPDGLAGEQIPLAARVVFCCDAYDAMTTDRPYRRALGHEHAVRELSACAGSQFDPVVVAAIRRTLDRRIRRARMRADAEDAGRLSDLAETRRSRLRRR